MNVDLSIAAVEDFDAIERWIAAHDRPAAIRLVDELKRKARSLDTMPNRYPELGDPELPGVRRLNHRGYRILFKVEPDRVLILHVHHGARGAPRA